MQDQYSTTCISSRDDGWRVAGCTFRRCGREAAAVDVWELQRRAAPWGCEWRAPFLIHEDHLKWGWVGSDFKRHPWTKGPRDEAARSQLPPIVFPSALKDGAGEWVVEYSPHACDEEGWQYAMDFAVPSLLWSSNQNLHLCRRRLWKCNVRKRNVEELHKCSTIEFLVEDGCLVVDVDAHSSAAGSTRPKARLLKSPTGLGKVGETPSTASTEADDEGSTPRSSRASSGQRKELSTEADEGSTPRSSHASSGQRKELGTEADEGCAPRPLPPPRPTGLGKVGETPSIASTEADGEGSTPRSSHASSGQRKELTTGADEGCAPGSPSHDSSGQRGEVDSEADGEGCAYPMELHRSLGRPELGSSGLERRIAVMVAQTQQVCTSMVAHVDEATDAGAAALSSGAQCAVDHVLLTAFTCDQMLCDVAIGAGERGITDSQRKLLRAEYELQELKKAYSEAIAGLARGRTSHRSHCSSV